MARLCTRLASGRLRSRKAPCEKPVTRIRVPGWKSAHVTWWAEVRCGEAK